MTTYFKIEFGKNSEILYKKSNRDIRPKKYQFLQIDAGSGNILILVNNKYGNIYEHQWRSFPMGKFRALFFDTDGTLYDQYLINDRAMIHIRNSVERISEYRTYGMDDLYYFGPNDWGDFTQNGCDLNECEDISRLVYCDLGDLYYSEDNDLWYRYEDNVPHPMDDDDSENDNHYVNDYHEGYSEFYLDDDDYHSDYRIGFEIEKEDIEVKQSISIRDFIHDHPLWRKERDGSLNPNSGFELISPVFPLDYELIESHIKSSHTLKSHINAGFSDKCGGHINISSKTYDPSYLYDRISGYFSILYALYPSRVNGEYSKGYSKDHMKAETGKRLAVNLKHSRIELRIFPAVRSVKNLLFRIRLVEFMLKNPATTLDQVNFDRLNMILSEIHDTEYKKSEFMDRVNKYEKLVSNQPELA